MRDTLLVFSRSMTLSLRNPTWVIIGLMQPILYLAFFGPLLKPLVHNMGVSTDNPWKVFVPGLCVQLALFGALFVGFGLIFEYRLGIIERLRVTPVSRLALLMGRVLRDVVVLLVQCCVLVGAGFAFGLRSSAASIVVALVIVALVGCAMSSLSYAAALLMPNEDSFAPLVNSIAVPLLLLSGILLPMQIAPRWLYDLSRINPLSHVVDGMRGAFLGASVGTVMTGVGVAIGLVVVGVAAGTATFRRRSA